jgi:diaminohydroxyphosphoribosylaminopyrimidine deaminase/5-amino-6-(5-phosphoribosylamino)uracil reductase
MIEGGARVVHDFHAAGLIDRYVLYVAPALFGGDDARPMFEGEGAATITDLWRGRIIDVTRLGDDLRIDLEPTRTTDAPRTGAS